MNLTMLDREQLENILLDPPRVEDRPLHCSDSITLDGLPTSQAERSTRIRHVLAAAHELLVRAANAALVGRCVLNTPDLVKDYFRVHFAGAERETFVVVFLDSKMRVIATEEMFAGTLDQSSVYPREVVKRALHHNAGGVIFGHPHPSGHSEPSSADEYLSKTLKSALRLVDVCVVDHLVVAGTNGTSFAERGLLWLPIQPVSRNGLRHVAAPRGRSSPTPGDVCFTCGTLSPASMRTTTSATTFFLSTDEAIAELDKH